MTFKTTKLRDAITFALAVGAIAGTGAALAQDPAPAATSETETTELDRIEVTGSRIKRVDVETSQPILTLSRQDLQQTGQTSIGDILQNISASGATLNTTFNNGGDGSTQVDLRNLGSNRTLVLVNGRRWIAGLGGSVDLNTIPIAAIERVEVLKDGASAIYGSDAISGVVNIITRQDFEGAEAGAYLGTTSYGDGSQEAYDFTIGSGTERSNVLLNASYVKQDAIFAGDREISAVPTFGLPANNVNAGASSTTRYGRFLAPGFDPPGTSVFDPTLGPGCIANHVCDASVLSSFRAYNPNIDGFNFAPENYLQTPQERIAIYGQGRYDITDNVRFKAELLFNERKSSQYLAPNPLTFGTRVPGGNLAPDSLGYTFNLSNDSIYNPFRGIPTAGDVAACPTGDVCRVQLRPPAFAPRIFAQDVDTFRFSGSLEGDFTIGERMFSWDAGVLYSDNELNQTTTGLQDYNKVKNAVGPSMLDPATGQPICVTTPGDASSVIQGCVPLNVFGGPGGVTREMTDYINFVAHDSGYNELKSYYANLTGEIAELPGGPLGFAVGVEHREENGFFEPDAVIAAGASAGSGADFTGGGFKLDELYAELNIPVLKDVPGAQLLEFNVAARYSDYNTFGETTNPKFGFKWKPFEDLLVRGNWSKGFRAPSIAELFTAQGDSFPIVFDPCGSFFLAGSRAIGTVSEAGADAILANCAADGVPGDYDQTNLQIRTTVGGNPELQPETSTTKTLGFVYSPSYAPGLGISLDWWNIEIENAIQARGAQEILTNCYQALPGDRDTAACALVTRDSTGAITDLQAFTRNQGTTHVEGYDFNVDYKFETGVGRFTIAWDSTYISKYETQLTSTSDVVSGVGNYTSNFPIWRLRSNLVLGWEKGDLGTSLTGRFHSHMDEDCSPIALAAYYAGLPELENLCSNPNKPADDFTGTPVRVVENRLESITYWDWQGTYKTPWNATVGIGVKNLFAKDPPFASQPFANSFDPQYEIPGRFYYLQYRQRF